VLLGWTGNGDPEVRAHLDVTSTPDLADLLVRENRRGLGIGSRILDEAERLVVSRGFDRIGVDVAVDNEGARRLYERRGYRECGLGPYVIGDSGVNEDGTTWAWEEEVEYLVKNLGPRALGEPGRERRSCS
jgi:ribosomal protein S18 acetylase RimI-like enzyme